MLSRILTENQQKLLAKERKFLRALGLALADLDIGKEEQTTFETSIQQLDELFLLVVVGEFNSGKSVCINCLLGQPILEEGVTPTTERICLLKYDEKSSRQSMDGSFDVITAPVELLREINIVDTPGTNAIQREHETITREFVPRSDLVLFVTSADRPFTESERAFLESIRDWGKKIVVAINKIDILESEEELDRVVGFVAENFETLLKVTPEIFPVSARQALRSKTDGETETAGRFDELERYIVSTLDEKERVRLKLLNPIGVGSRFVEKYLEVVDQRLGLLKEDFRTLEEIDRQLDLYKEDLGRDFRFRLADIDNVLLDFENRGTEYFDETMRLTRVFELANRSKIKSDFERKVVADLPQLIEKRVGEVIDWMVASELRQWQAIMEYLESRKTQSSDRIVGTVGGRFAYDRERLLDTVGRAARRAVDSYDRDQESTRLAESVQMAVASAALLEVGAVGLGTIVSLIASTTLADMTGIFAAGALSVVGFLVIPARRRKAKRELHQKVARVREQLMSALTGQFQHEIEESLARIRGAISPYTRFVRSERDRLSDAQNELVRIRDGLNKLKSEVKML
jgi:small GTP-binding protein